MERRDWNRTGAAALLDAGVQHDERVLFHTPTFCVIEQEAAPCEPTFGAFGPLRVPRIEYPRRSCEVFVEGHAPFVADPTRVVFFGPRSVCRRRAIDPLGARATVIGLRPDALFALFPGEEDPAGIDASRAPREISSPLDLRLHEESVALANRLSSGVPFDEMAAEEATLNLVSRTLGSHLAWSRATRTRPVAPGQLEMVAAVKLHISENIGQKMSLTQLSAVVGVSPFYLCRFFRAATGQTVYQYQLQMRLSAALEMLPEYRGNLAALAMDLGFSSHSHLATLFKRAYGYSPGSARQRRRAEGVSLGGPGL